MHPFVPTFYGERGVFKEVNGKAQCHICGKTFHHLGAHVSVTHEMTADDYCDEFGLNRSQGLISSQLAEKRRMAMHIRFQDQEFRKKWDAKLPAKGTCPAHASGCHMRPRSLQARMHPTNVERRLKGAERRARDHAASEDFKSGGQRRKEWKAKIAAAKRKHHVLPCSFCGNSITQVGPMLRHTCSHECLIGIRRQNSEKSRTPEVAIKISIAAKKRVLVRNQKGQITGYGPV